MESDDVPSCVEKEGTQIFNKKSMKILWNFFNNILWTTDDSAIGRSNICGDPDSTIVQKKKRVLVLNVWIK